MDNDNLDFLCRYIGKTVTIFTTSGGISGSGFTGVLINVNSENVTLLISAGCAPSCPIGSSCDCGSHGRGAYGRGRNRGNQNRNFGFGFNRGYYDDDCNDDYNNDCCCDTYMNPLGAVTVIPVCSIAAFTHNAI